MVTIIVGAIGAGKTSYMTAKLNEQAFNAWRKQKQFNELKRLEHEFKRPFRQPTSIVATNYNFIAKKAGYKDIPAIRFNDENIGLPAHDENAVAFAPFTAIGIMEAQNVFNSRLWRDFGRNTGAFFEWSRHFGFDIFLDTQNFDLIDKTVREIAVVDFIENRRIFDERGKEALSGQYIRPRDFGAIQWQIRRYNNARDYENGTFQKIIYKTETNIFQCYNERENRVAFVPIKGGFAGV